MSKYRHKPIEVFAIRWEGDNQDDIRQFLMLHAYSANFNFSPMEGSKHPILTVVTVQGSHVLVPTGDYLVIDVLGFPYPCNHQVFNATHEWINK